MLFECIDRRRISWAVVPKRDAGTRVKNRQKKRSLQPFTLVLATDQPGLLLDALRKRFPTTVHLGAYPLKEMKEIVATIAAEKEVLLSRQATSCLARVCHGLPRKAVHYLQKLRHFFPAECVQLSSGRIKEFLRAFRVDTHGFGPLERRYLRFLSRNRRVSLETIAQALGTDKQDVLRQIEPILVRKGLVAIAPSGRKLTEKGKKLVRSKIRSNQNGRKGDHAEHQGRAAAG